MDVPLSEKIVTLETLADRFGRPRNARLVFTNGCFDILHRGHVEYLHFARSQGDHLVVALNSDASVRQLKGPGRPYNSQEDRAMVLAGLASVDAVTIFDDDTPLRVIQRLLPDVLVKGGDYLAADVVGAETVQGIGGDVVIAPLVPGRSTTGLIERTRSRACE